MPGGRPQRLPVRRRGRPAPGARRRVRGGPRSPARRRRGRRGRAADQGPTLGDPGRPGAERRLRALARRLPHRRHAPPAAVGQPGHDREPSPGQSDRALVGPGDRARRPAGRVGGRGCGDGGRPSVERRALDGPRRHRSAAGAAGRDRRRGRDAGAGPGPVGRRAPDPGPRPVRPHAGCRRPPGAGAAGRGRAGGPRRRPRPVGSTAGTRVGRDRLRRGRGQGLGPRRGAAQPGAGRVRRGRRGGQQRRGVGRGVDRAGSRRRCGRGTAPRAVRRLRRARDLPPGRPAGHCRDDTGRSRDDAGRAVRRPGRCR